jgi:hypothetical protein
MWTPPGVGGKVRPHDGPLTISRVARWFIFKSKIQLWVIFGGPWNGKCCCSFMTVWHKFGHLLSFLAVWYSLWSFGIFFQFWYVWTKKNMAALTTSPELDDKSCFLRSFSLGR